MAPSQPCTGGQTAEQRRAGIAAERTTLTEHEESVREIATWLRDNVRPIKTPTVGNYGMKHVVEPPTSGTQSRLRRHLEANLINIG